ncbi:MAG: hydroxymethylbilane synthase [Planctomycetota bacterium]|jgi:hydroxymethylbilane synthase
MNRTFVIGTRGSTLAVRQAGQVKELLEKNNPSLSCELRIIKTTGDRITDASLSRIGGKGLFTKEIEEALLGGDIDCAVHSMKDLPTSLPEGLKVGAVLPRENEGDAFISKKYGSLAEMPQGAEIGTSSLRRRAQLLAARPDLKVIDLRGNLDTRLRKIAEGNPPAAILAVAGMRRLGRENEITEIIGKDIMLPAVAQGAIAVEIQGNDSSTGRILESLHCNTTALCCSAERAFLRRLEGGCQIPVGASAKISGGRLNIDGVVADLAGKKVIRGSAFGMPDDAEKTGVELAESLLESGAEEILNEIRGGIANEDTKAVDTDK